MRMPFCTALFAILAVGQRAVVESCRKEKEDAGCRCQHVHARFGVVSTEHNFHPSAFSSETTSPLRIAMERSAAETRELSTRLKYLDEAAHVLALASPETSSFLESQYSYLVAENDLTPPDSRKKDVCGACGTILIPGLSCTITQETNLPLGPKKKGSNVEKRTASKDNIPKKMKIYSCSRCSSKTRLPIQSTKARMNAPKPAKASTAASSTTTVAASAQPTEAKSSAATNAAVPVSAPPNPAPAAANASSKKRAKARKGGLQALLANSKKDTGSSKGFGLDLMDLMRSE